jgi:formylglycine-generating enzyme required for sulfatase activity
MNRTAMLGLLSLFACGVSAICGQEKPSGGNDERMLINSLGMKLVLIPPGKFLMGSPQSEAERDADETQHEVAVTRPFYLGAYEVTQAQYQQVMGKNPSFFHPNNTGGTEHPVEQVKWGDAGEFCRKLSEMPAEKAAARMYRLPTEAEWEYACRAGTTSAFHFGDALSSTQANCNGNFPYGGAAKGPYLARTAKVGSYPANAFGLHDMHGNVWEWCSDWYDEKYYQRSPKENPPGPSQGVLSTGFHGDFYRVARGGCWLDEPRGCRAAYRFRFMTSDPYRLVGFRVVCVAGMAK